MAAFHSCGSERVCHSSSHLLRISSTFFNFCFTSSLSVGDKSKKLRVVGFRMDDASVLVGAVVLHLVKHT